MTLKQCIRAAIGDRGRSFVTRTKYALGRRPRVNHAAAGSLSYPEGRRAAIVISADLELAWAWRYAREFRDPLAFARQRAYQGRHNLPIILELCDQYGLPVTWATVGHLFLEHCDRADGRAHPEMPRVPYFQNEFWAYRAGDWFDSDPGATCSADPEWLCWYAPDLVTSILKRRVAHEIGCHTFSHVVFSDKHCPNEVAAAELRCCQEAARLRGIVLRSFVFPGNVPGNYGSLRDAGFVAYRIETAYELDVPRRDGLGLWQIPGGITLEKPYRSWTAAEQVRLLRTYVDAAIAHGLVCSFWFHPETDPSNVTEVFQPIFEYIASRPELWVTTMSDLARWLDAEVTQQYPARATSAAS